MREEAVRRRLDRLQFADAVDAATAAADDPLEVERQWPTADCSPCCLQRDNPRSARMVESISQQCWCRSCLKCLKVMLPVAQELGSDDWLLAGQPREAVEYCVPATGAKVTLASAKQLIFHFCTRLPSDRSVSPR